ncbi:MAG: hypothetical protein ACP5E4_01535 [Candidatus Aenigmatarchaeota archaeon]
MFYHIICREAGIGKKLKSLEDARACREYLERMSKHDLRVLIESPDYAEYRDMTEPLTDYKLELLRRYIVSPDKKIIEKMSEIYGSGKRGEEYEM